MHLTDSAGLDARTVLAVARGELVLELGDELIGWLDERRAWMLAALDIGDPVYGVTTGMGAMSEVGLDPAARARQSETLLTARAAGGPLAQPGRDPRGPRRAAAPFLNGDAAVSAALCGRLAESIALGVLPAIPRRSTGAAGEIVGLAHLGAALTGAGDVLVAGRKRGRGGRGKHWPKLASCRCGSGPRRGWR